MSAGRLARLGATRDLHHGLLAFFVQDLPDSRVAGTVRDATGLPLLDAAYPGRPGTGRGLELTRRRLRSAYGGDGARFTTEHSGGDFVAVLDLPVREHVV